MINKKFLVILFCVIFVIFFARYYFGGQINQTVQNSEPTQSVSSRDLEEYRSLARDSITYNLGDIDNAGLYPVLLDIGIPILGLTGEIEGSCSDVSLPDTTQSLTLSKHVSEKGVTFSLVSTIPFSTQAKSPVAFAKCSAGVKFKTLTVLLENLEEIIL